MLPSGLFPSAALRGWGFFRYELRCGSKTGEDCGISFAVDSAPSSENPFLSAATNSEANWRVRPRFHSVASGFVLRLISGPLGCESALPGALVSEVAGG